MPMCMAASSSSEALAEMTIFVYFLPMPRVVVVVFPGVQTLDLAGPAEVFAAARYEVVIASTKGGELATTSGLSVRTRRLASIRPRRTDRIVVAGGDERAITRAVADAALRRWLVRAAGIARRLTSVCSGAFILAAAGLLDGKRATT